MKKFIKKDFMANNYSYQEIINELNKFKIIKLSFFIEGYSHYKNCIIYKIEDPTLCMQIELTKDNSEKIKFRKFVEDYKLFNFGRKGKFTLKQVWDKVCITEIEYSD